MAPASRATQVPLATAKNELSALVDRVEHGEAITITRRGVPVVRLVQHQPCADSAHMREAVVDAVAAQLRQVDAHAPWLLQLEFTNVLRTACRRGTMQIATAQGCACSCHWRPATGSWPRRHGPRGLGC